MSLVAELKRRNVIRVATGYIALAWLVVQVLDSLSPLFGISDGAARLIVIVIAIGFAPFMVVAWVFELTPDGFKRDGEVDHSSQSSQTSAKKLDRIVIAVLAIAVVYFTFDKFILDPARDEDVIAEATQQAHDDALVGSFGDRSIAVLPFKNLSADPDQEYFGDGIAEEMLHLLARIPELRVISRSSAFLFKDSELTIPDIAGQLNVAHVLEGSVRKSGNTLRITAQLIDARVDKHIWSRTFDRQLDDVFAIQDEVAAAVVEELHLSLVGEIPTTTRVDPVAYSLFLRAKNIYNLEGDYEAAEAMLREALELEPNYVDALSVLWWRSEIDRDETYSRLKEHAPEKAAVLDSWGGQMTDPIENARIFTKALRLDPADTSTLFFSAGFACGLGRFELAVKYYEFMIAREPLMFWGHLQLGECLYSAGREEEAFKRFELAIELNSGAGDIRWKYGLALIMSGRTEEALIQFESEDLGDPYRTHGKAVAFHHLGRTEDSKAAFDWLIEVESDPWPFGLARAYALVGNTDEAFHYLDRAIAGQHWMGGDIALNAKFRNLHDDPRWLPLLQSIGYGPEQRDAIEFGDHLPN